MQRVVVCIAACALLASGPALGQLVDFNDTAPANDAVSYGSSPVAFGAFTFTAISSSQFSLDPGYDTSNRPPTGTDFETFENGSADWTISSGVPFTLNGFRAAAIYGDGGGTLTVTGNINGGGTVVQVLNLPAFTSRAQWRLFLLGPGFTNLTSVDFDYSGQFVGLDDVAFNGAAIPQVADTPIPALAPSSLVVLSLLLAAATALALARRARA